MGERSEEARRAEFEASRELPLPTERTLDDFPVGTEVVVYAMVWSQRELRRGTVVKHSEHGFVVVEPETKERGVPLPSNLGGNPNPSFPRFSPRSPGLLRPQELAALCGSQERARRWVERGDLFKDAERRRLADKIAAYSGYEGRPTTGGIEPAVRERTKGVNKAGWGGD